MVRAKTTNKIVSLFLSFVFLFSQTGMAQAATELNLAAYLSPLNYSPADKLQLPSLRYFSYDNFTNNLQIVLDKGDLKEMSETQAQDSAQQAMAYFLIGITLPDDSFWVNLRPDSPDNMIDDYLAQTDIGKIMLEADVELKKDTARFTSPQTPEGKLYWDKLYKKAGELFGSENITIPTLTRPWIVPGEVIVREATDSAYIYKAGLKVMLEQDHLKDSAVYNFSDPRLKTLNEYSSRLIRELIIPKLTKEVNTSRKYAPLRQVYYSLIMARWFKARFYGKAGTYTSLIDKKNLSGLTSRDAWSKLACFNAYQKSFKEGEYNLQVQVPTLAGQSIRSYFSGGIKWDGSLKITGLSSPVGNFMKKITGNSSLVVFSGNPKDLKASTKQEITSVVSSPVSNKENAALGKMERSLAFYTCSEFARNLEWPVANYGLTAEKIAEIDFDMRSPYMIYVIETVADPRIINAAFVIYDKQKALRDLVERVTGKTADDVNTLKDDFRNEIKKRLEAGSSPLLNNAGVETFITMRGMQAKKLVLNSFGRLRSLGFEEEFNQMLPSDTDVLKIINEQGRVKIDFSYDIEEPESVLYRVEGGEEVGSIKNKQLNEWVESILSDVLKSQNKTPRSGNLYDRLSLIAADRSFQGLFGLKIEIDSDKFSLEVYAFPEKQDDSDLSSPLQQKMKDAVKKAFDSWFGSIHDVYKQYIASDYAASIKWDLEQGRFLNLLNGRILEMAQNEEEAGVLASAVLQKITYKWTGLVPFNATCTINTQEARKFLSKESQRIMQIAGRNSSPIKTEDAAKGGIDFRSIPMTIQPIGDFGSIALQPPQAASLENINPDAELRQLVNMVQSGMLPSSQRVKELVYACYYKDELPKMQGDLVNCLTNICRLQEEQGVFAESEFKESLVLLEAA